MSETMIERLARSIAASFVSQNHMLELDEDGMGYSNDYDNRWYDCRPAARAAIEAMRIPPEEMVLAGLNCDAWADNEGNAVEMLSGTFTAMISAALKEPTK